jgi:methylenetetrahydrofolate reductase (NADPH)
MSEFAERLRGPGLAVALEITPPKKRLDDVLLRRAGLLGSQADAINVIQRPDRLSSLDASLILRQAGLDAICHLVNRGRSRAEISSELRSASADGLDALLCVRGDHAAEDGPDTPRIRDVVAMAGNELPQALIGVTANQYGPRERVLANLAPKLRAGAAFVQTNPVFDVARFEPFAAAIKALAPGVHVVPMVMPLDSLATARRLRERLGFGPGAETLSRLESGGEVEGWRIFAEIIRGLAASPWISGVAVMTPEMDAAPASAQRIAEALAAVRG